MSYHPTTDPAASIDPQTELDAMAHLLRCSGCWERAEMSELWPLTSPEAAQLLRDGFELAIDEAGLLDLIHRGILDRPGIGEQDEFEWDAADIVRAGLILQRRKQFPPAPCDSDRAKWLGMIALEEARKLGTVAELLAGKRPDVRQVLAAMVQCDDAETRGSLAVQMLIVLELEHDLEV